MFNAVQICMNAEVIIMQLCEAHSLLFTLNLITPKTSNCYFSDWKCMVNDKWTVLIKQLRVKYLAQGYIDMLTAL